MRRALDGNLQDTEPDISHPLSVGSGRQLAEIELRVTKEAGFRAKVDVSNGGLLSIAALVSGILLSTAVLVHVATRDAKSQRLWR
ncbi:MAG: hypothetical protein ACK4P4_01690 [Allorhizobium sp.]